MAFDAGDIETTLNLDRTPFNQGLDKAERDARAFEKKKFKARIDVEIDQKQIDRDINRSTAGKKPKVEIEAEIDQQKVAKQIDAIANNTEKTAARSGNRIARALLNPIMIQLGLLPGVAAVAAAGAGAALLLPVAAFGAWGIAAAKGTAEVKNAWADLKKDLIDGSKEISGPMRDALVDIMKDAQSVWASAKPVVAGMFAEAAPHVKSFAGSLLGLVVNTLPGMNVALQRGQGFMIGWSGLLGQVGTGISDLADNASRVVRAEQAMSQFGRTVQILLGFVGNLVARFTDVWAMIGGPFNMVLEKAARLTESFANGALPAMAGGLTVLLGILGAVADVLGPVMGFLGSGVGTILAAAAAYKLLTAAMSGIGRAGMAVKNAVGNVAQNVGTATATMGLFGRTTKETADKVDKAAEGQGKFARLASNTGKTLSTVGNALPIIGAAFAVFGGIVSAVEDDIQKKIAERNRKWDEQRDIAERAADRIRTSQDQAAAATLQYNKAVADMGPASEIAKGAQERLATATLREKDAQEDAAAATKTHTERLLDFFEALAGGLSKQVAYNNTIKDVKEKQDALTESIKLTGKGSLDTKFASDELSLALANQVKAAGELAIANSIGKSSYDKMVAGQQATALEAIKLINIFGTQAPPALYQTVAAMSDAELQAIGGRREFDKMGNAIIHVPEYKPIHIDSNMHAAAQEAATLKNRVDTLPRGTIYLTYIIDTVAKGGPDPSLNSLTGALRGRNAAGTGNWRGGLTTVDEQGPELIQLPSGAKVFTNRATQSMMERMMVNIASATSRAGQGETNPATMAALLANAVASAMSGIRLVFDGSAARLVNAENSKNRRR